MGHRGLKVVAFLVLVLCARTVEATTFIPVSVEDLAQSSVAAVIGSVTQVSDAEDADGRIVTLVDLTAEELLHGSLPSSAITLKESGGSIGGRTEVLFGVPQFEVGERVLVFLTLWPDGSLRTNHLALGQFLLQTNANGTPVARQAFGPDTRFLTPRGKSAPPAEIALAALRAEIDAAGPAALPSVPVRSRPPESAAALPRSATPRFTFRGPARFFEPDLHQPLRFLIDQTGDATLGLAVARGAVDDAFAAWNNVASATIELADAGLTDDLTLPCPGPHKVRFNDPDNEIPNPVNCSGVLGLGGVCVTDAETKGFGGTTFQQVVRGELTLADGFQGCETWTPCNIAEVATHEIGHAVGLGHSSENPNEPDPVLKDATMYYLAHFDGRCAGVRTDDIAAISTLYPTAVPPTITTRAFHVATAHVPYRQVLQAVGGVGAFTWIAADGGFPGLDLQSDGIFSGTPSTHGSSFLKVTAVDGNGESHTKTFDIEVALESPPAPDGDANCDGTVNAADLTALVSLIPTNDTQSCPNADAVPDAVLDAADGDAIVGRIFRRQI